MSSHRIGEAVNRQFERTFSTLRDAISKLDDNQWSDAEVDWLIPARQAYHLVESADFYASETDPLKLKWQRLESDWERSAPPALPSRQRLLDYLDEVQSRVRNRLLSLDDEQMLADATFCKWCGPTVLDRLLYALRHIQHHTAIINSELRRRNLPRGNWA